MFSPVFSKYFWIAGYVLGFVFVPIVLMRKKNPVSAISWTLAVIFIPYLGVLSFLILGASYVKRRLRKKIFHRSRFLREWTMKSLAEEISSATWADMNRYSSRVGGAPACNGNEIELYKDGKQAFKDKYAAIRAAKHHIHLEYFILRNDETGRTLIDILCKKAAQGVKVRLLLDGIGSLGTRSLIRKLQNAGGKTASFLPAQLFSPRFTMGLRNHRKILICDGTVAFIGGLNIGDEYLGKVRTFGYWRDTHMKIRGPAVLSLQRVFAEDWDFAAKELISGDTYFPSPWSEGKTQLQIVWSGPDQEENATREIFFAAFTSARKTLWVCTPYFVPDSALLTALIAAARRGVDVRILTQSYPSDHWLTYWAGRYYWENLLNVGARVFEYKKGMMHAKIVIADGAWACVGSSNLDIRSLRLNFEVNGNILSAEDVKKVEEMFLEDQKHSKEITLGVFNKRPVGEQLLENVCRLFSPLL